MLTVILRLRNILQKWSLFYLQQDYAKMKAIFFLRLYENISWLRLFCLLKHTKSQGPPNCEQTCREQRTVRTVRFYKIVEQGEQCEHLFGEPNPKCHLPGEGFPQANLDQLAVPTCVSTKIWISDFEIEFANTSDSEVQKMKNEFKPPLAV